MSVYERKAVQNIKSNDTEKWKRTLKISEKKTVSNGSKFKRKIFSLYTCAS